MAVGTIAATVNIPKLRKTCFGVRRETEARLRKWKGGDESYDLGEGLRWISDKWRR